MALIKAANSEHSMRDAIVLDLGEIGRLGERLLSRAQAEADRMLEEARANAAAETDEIRERARAEGFERGLAEGREAGLSEGRQSAHAEFAERLGALEAALAEAVEAFAREREGMLSEARGDALTLALDVARRVTKRVVDADPGVAAAQAEAALRTLGRRTEAQVRVHPDDLAAVREALPALAERVDAARGVELAPDDALTRGSCVVRTRRGEIDASIEGQLDRIADALVSRGGAS